MYRSLRQQAKEKERRGIWVQGGEWQKERQLRIRLMIKIGRYGRGKAAMGKRFRHLAGQVHRELGVLSQVLHRQTNRNRSGSSLERSFEIQSCRFCSRHQESRERTIKPRSTNSRNSGFCNYQLPTEKKGTSANTLLKLVVNVIWFNNLPYCPRSPFVFAVIRQSMPYLCSCSRT